MSSIVTEGIKTLFFFFTNFKKKKSTNPTLNKPNKEFSTLNNKLNNQLTEQLIKHKKVFHGTPMEDLL